MEGNKSVSDENGLPCESAPLFTTIESSQSVPQSINQLMIII